MARALSLTNLGVVQLIASRRLEAVLHDDPLRVRAQALDDFKARYVRLSTIAHGVREGDALEEICGEHGMPVWHAESRLGRSAYAMTDDAKRALALAKARYGTSPQGRFVLP